MRVARGWLSATVAATTIAAASAVTMDAARAADELTVTITAPLPGTAVQPGDPVTVTGNADDGSATSQPINIIYVMDNSGSTAAAGGSCGDPNGDAAADTILDCEIAGLAGFNDQAPSDVDVSLVVFDDTAEIIDVGPASGVQTTTKPNTDADGNGTPDVEDALRAVMSTGGTDFDGAIAQANSLLVSGERNIVIFLSDGLSPISTGPGSPLQDAVDSGAIIFTFAVGTATAGCGAGESLRTIAESTGGTCTEVADPAQLSPALAGISVSGISRVEIDLNGTTLGNAAVETDGDFTFVIPAALLDPGRNDIVARAVAADEQTATASTYVTLARRCTIGGTQRPDTIRGTPGPDVICGNGGDDTIYGLGGNDAIYGGPGDDTIYGGPGSDRLFGRDGTDKLVGGNGRDILETRDGVGGDIADGSGDSDECRTDRRDIRINCP